MLLLFIVKLHVPVTKVMYDSGRKFEKCRVVPIHTQENKNGLRSSEIITVAILASAHKMSQLCPILAVLFTILSPFHTITNFLPGLIETFHLCLVAKDYSVA